ncbi:MAG TPA: hypothetical protein PLZ84_02135 [Clostridia bacterium]|nr:hypothetical protein [Clostridia bacterium]
MDWIIASVVLKQANALYSLNNAATGLCKLEKKGGHLYIDINAQYLKPDAVYKAAIAPFGERAYVVGNLEPKGKKTYSGRFVQKITGDITRLGVCIFADGYPGSIVLAGQKGEGEFRSAFDELISQASSKSYEPRTPQVEKAESKKPVDEVNEAVAKEEKKALEAPLAKETQTIVKEQDEPTTEAPPAKETQTIVKEQDEPETNEADYVEDDDPFTPVFRICEKIRDDFRCANLDKVFKSGERIQQMEDRIPGSYWVKSGQCYMLGMLFDPSDTPEYVFYGLPASSVMSATDMEACRKIKSVREKADEECFIQDEYKSYFEKNKNEIMAIFEKGRPSPDLEQLIPGSKWVWVDEENDVSYVMGLINDEDQTPLYICYGVPSYYSSEPPQGMAGYCQWLPASIEDPKGKGYWMMYQDAMTGHTVEP